MSMTALCQPSYQQNSPNLIPRKSVWMNRELESIFDDLGLAQYLDTFVDQGFDAWDTILDIQESDLDALGVKLGHRRKLQRRIANDRGLASSVSLGSSSKAATEAPKRESPRRETSRPDVPAEHPVGVQKRKYRRHPKPDEHAPERPPSAYVLFSNKMREDLKTDTLTFTEIAKLVGEHWQSLDPGEKEKFETEANTAKEKYHAELALYKKTPEFREYAEYLQEFKEKQAKSQKGQEPSRRSKAEPARLRHGSTSSSATPHTANSNSSSSGSGSGNSSEHLRGSEPPPTRRERMDSTASMAGSQYSSTAQTPMSTQLSFDESGLSPRTMQFDGGSPTESRHRHSRQLSSARGKNRNEAPLPQLLPSLSDMLDARQGITSQPSGGSGRPSLDTASVLPGARVGPPTLRHESSSNMSGSSVGSFGRPHGEGSLPIHALLSDRTAAQVPGFERHMNPIMAGVASRPQVSHGLAHGMSGYGFQSDSSPFQHMRVEQMGDGDVVMTSDETMPRPDTMPRPGSRNTRRNLDGMDALLRAGEIVGRGGRR